MQRTATFLVFGILVLIATRGYGQSTKELFGPKIELSKRAFEVQITINGDRHSPEVESYLTRNLRSLADVRLVERTAFIHLYVSVIDLTNGAKAYSGSSLAVVVTYPLQNDQIEHFLGPPVDDPLDRGKRTALRDMEVYETTIVMYAPAGKLKDACEHVVTDLDIKYLKPSRDIWMQIDKAQPVRR
jgi:hypothetical protein